MATPTGTRVQTWLEPRLARELKELADADGRSVSGLIRVVLQEQLETSPSGGEAWRSAGFHRASRRAAGAAEE